MSEAMSEEENGTQPPPLVLLCPNPQLSLVQMCVCVCVKVAHLCPTLCDPMDCIVHGIFQARILEWGAVPM